MIGPNVIQAIIDNTGKFFTALSLYKGLTNESSQETTGKASRSCLRSALLRVWLSGSVSPHWHRGVSHWLTRPWKGVDVTTGRRDAVAWAEKNRRYIDTGILGEDEDDGGDYGKRT